MTGQTGATRKRKTLSQRLMQALTGEIRALERAIAEVRPVEAGEPGGNGPAAAAAAAAAGAKARVDAIGALTRTLEKLMDLTRLEAAAVRSGEEEDTEAERLRAELMKRLRALDARRGSGRRLFQNAAAIAIA